VYSVIVSHRISGSTKTLVTGPSPTQVDRQVTACLLRPWRSLPEAVSSSFFRLRSHFALTACLTLACLLVALPCVRAQEQVFGSAENKGQTAIIGILYDLKQTQQREPTKETPGTYRNVIAEFLKSNWDEDILNRYFRVTRPLYTTQIFIPAMNADEAPKAFGVSDLVKPRMWVVHYKGQVAAPERGVYRFSGEADDIMAVRINGRTVLVAGRPGCLPPKSVWSASEGDVGGHRLGDWVSLKAGEVVDFDVIIGERPGVKFLALLYVEKQGATASANPPIFKLASSPPPKSGTFGPDTPWSIWTAKQ